MSAVEQITAALDEAGRLLDAATPPPWHDGKGDNRYAALVSDQPVRGRPANGGWEYDQEYGGYLIGESMQAHDRALIAPVVNRERAQIAHARDVLTLIGHLRTVETNSGEVTAVTLASADILERSLLATWCP